MIRMPQVRIRGRVVLIVLLTALLMGGGIGVAQAHDSLVSTSPADGATLATVPSELTLTFNNTPIGIGDEVKVLDPSGTDQADGAITITDSVVTQKLKPGAPAGKYTVEWRVVSSDSHPIEGTFTFTATASGTAAAGSAGAASGSAPSATASSAPATSNAAPASGASPLPIIVIVVGVLLLAGFGAWMVLSGRRHRQEDPGR